MKPYYADESVTLYHGDCLEVLAMWPDASVDAVVTDPPFVDAGGDRTGAGVSDYRAYRLRARRITSVTVSPRSCALICAATHTSWGTRTERRLPFFAGLGMRMSNQAVGVGAARPHEFVGDVVANVLADVAWLDSEFRSPLDRVYLDCKCNSYLHVSIVPRVYTDVHTRASSERVMMP